MQPFEESQDDQVKIWLGRFGSVLRLDPTWTAEEIKAQLATLSELRAAEPELQAHHCQDRLLASTFEDARLQVPAVESELRQRLAKLAPGDPEAHVDLSELRLRLAELEARQEVGAPVLSEERQTLLTTSANWLAAGFLIIFGCGFGGFSLLHAVFMIGGMRSAFGNAAFLLLLFYGIFFAATGLLFLSAYRQASTEKVDVKGLALTQTLDFLGMTRKKSVTFQLPVLVEEELVTNSGRFGGNPFAVTVTDAAGNRMRVGETATAQQRAELRKRLSAHFALANNPKPLP